MIEKVTIKNFKAIQSATIKLTDLSVFVGNNGSGKSSVIEALQILQNVLLYGLSNAFQNRWYGLEYVHNVTNKKSTDDKLFEDDIEINIQGKIKKDKFDYKACFNAIPNGDLYWITHESLLENKTIIYKLGEPDKLSNQLQTKLILADNNDPFAIILRNYITSWQFLSLEPERMYFPTHRDYSTENVRLKNTGENLADFFRRLQDNSSLSNLIIDKLRYVLPDLIDVAGGEIPVQKMVYLFLAERHHNDRLPSWLFSSGTLRILTFLALLNSETPPPVLFIEEIENGLDPRTLNLLVEEFRGLMPQHQFIATTHSPYFLDLVDLKHIIVAERDAGETEYYRPNDDKRLNDWKEKFSAGNLYTMNKLSRK
ncbi:MAG: AAA family ATPase [Planctomycetaceae bacterium]|jgi:predicted ATPase|nr:AAA family ATPase [Planctomycetaceae bacterium]